MSDEIKFFEHPDYKALKAEWELYRDLYEGRHEKLSSPQYLWLHEFEASEAGKGANLREIREHRTRYVNLEKPFIKRFVSLVFKSDIDTANVNDLFGDCLEDVDGKGTSFENFIKNQVAESYFLFGRSVVYCDSFRIDAKSKGDAEKLGKRPYLELWQPEAVKDWQYETVDPARIGKLNAIRYEYKMIEPRFSLSKEPKETQYTRILQREEGGYVIETYKQTGDGGDRKWSIADEQRIGLDEIPIVLTDTQSWVKDVAPVALLRHNTQSALDSQLLFQAFQRMIFIGNFTDTDGKRALNEANATFVNGEGSLQVVEPSNPIALRERLDSVTNDMFKIAFQQTRHMPSDAKSVEGFQTLREAKEDFLATLTNAAKDLEGIINNTIRIWAKFKGVEYNAEAHRIELETDFTIEDVDQQVNIARAHWDEINKYPTWREETNKKIASQMNLQDQDKIKEEIEGGPVEVGAEQRSALLQSLVDDDENGTSETDQEGTDSTQ